MDKNIDDRFNVMQNSKEFFENQEVASFSLYDIQKLIETNKKYIDLDCIDENKSVEVNHTESAFCEDNSKYNLNICVKHSLPNQFGIANNLILDDCCNYICDDQRIFLDGNLFNPNFCIKGVFEDIYAKNSDRNFNLRIKNIGSCFCDSSDEVDTSYGFKLSQIIRNLNPMNLEFMNFSNGFGNIDFSQKVFLLKKDFLDYIILNFKIKNNGKGSAYKILFKDMLPENVSLFDRGIFIDGNSVDKDNIDLKGKRILLRIDELKQSQEINLMLVGLFNGSFGTINFGSLIYVSESFVLDGINNINVVQQLSNIEILKKGCIL